MTGPRGGRTRGSREVLEVLQPGLLTTVQDGGRPELGHVGVSPGGVADPWAAMLANRLVGLPTSAALLEVTAIGPRLRVLEDIVVGLAGADLGAVAGPAGEVDAGRGRAVEAWSSHHLEAGEELAVRGDATAGEPGRGLRAYLAVDGGIDVPLVLGSAATALLAGFGGFDGRALRAGDRLAANPSRRTELPAWPSMLRVPPELRMPPGSTRGVVRVVAGPAGRGTGSREDALRALCATSWRVAPTSDRMGLRLDGAALPDVGAADLPSHGVVRGAVQVPPDGHPIVLLADHQPTGGYPVVAVAIEADVTVLAQLAPGEAVRFEPVTVAAALEARRAMAAAAARLEAALGRTGETDDGWHDLWRWARA